MDDRQRYVDLAVSLGAADAVPFGIGDIYLAFSMSDCAVCRDCAGFKGGECADPKKARPAFHSVGIDVFATAHRFGLPLQTLASAEEEQNWYAAVFVE